MSIGIVFGQLKQDLRFGMRSTKAAPGFAAAVVSSLALGIAAATAMFSVIHGVILDPFPYSHPETLMSIRVREPNFEFTPFLPSHYLDLAENNHVFDEVIASTISDVILTGTSEPERLRGNFVTTNTFSTLGVPPLLGRAIRPADGKPDAEPVVVLGYPFWKRHFGGDPNVLGSRLRLNDKIRTVIGVMPSRFMWRGADVYLPIVLARGKIVDGVRYINVLGRLKAGLTVGQAEAALHPVVQDILSRDAGYRQQSFRVQMLNFYETYPSSIRKELWVLLGGVSLLLLIACANVSNLMLARSAARSREIAVRGSLGAGKWRIARQLLTESMITGTAGAMLGMALSYGLLFAVKAIIPPDTIPDESDVSLNASVLIFAVAISFLTSLLAGVSPAFHASRLDLAASMKSAGRGFASSLREKRLRNILVSAEVALAMMLLVAASLVARTLWNLQDLRLGYRPDRVLSMRLPLPENRYGSIAARNGVLADIVSRIHSVPGVEEVALNHFVHPFANWGTDIVVPGSSAQPHRPAIMSQISATYPSMFGLPLKEGRLLTAQEIALRRQVVLVNETLARTYFAAGQAVGSVVRLPQLKSASIPDDAFTIVGVVGDVRNVGLTSEIYSEVYMPYTLTGFSDPLTQPLLLVFSRVPPTSLAGAIRTEIHKVDPDQPVMQVRTVATLLDQQGFATPRFGAFLFSAFAGLGLLLSVIGVYGVVTYSVSRQLPALGIRMALGATRSTLFGIVLRQGLRLMLVGILGGGVCGLLLTRLMSALLWRVSPLDPTSFALAGSILLAAGIVACLPPGWRASRADPMTVLRLE